MATAWRASEAARRMSRIGRPVRLVRTVREIQAEDVHARVNQLPDHSGSARGGPERRDDLRAPFLRLHRFPSGAKQAGLSYAIFHHEGHEAHEGRQRESLLSRLLSVALQLSLVFFVPFVLFVVR